jgi:hypothetical protein
MSVIHGHVKSHSYRIPEKPLSHFYMEDDTSHLNHPLCAVKEKTQHIGVSIGSALDLGQNPSTRNQGARRLTCPAVLDRSGFKILLRANFDPFVKKFLAKRSVKIGIV